MIEIDHSPLMPHYHALATARHALSRTRERKAMLGALRPIDGPAWEMLLDLFICYLEGRKLSISSLCFTSGLPMTNSLRIVEKLMAAELVCRERDPADGRRHYVVLREKTVLALYRYLTHS